VVVAAADENGDARPVRGGCYQRPAHTHVFPADPLLKALTTNVVFGSSHGPIPLWRRSSKGKASATSFTLSLHTRAPSTNPFHTKPQVISRTSDTTDD